MSTSSENSLLMQAFFAAGARGLVEAQQALDERGRDSLIAWEQEGRPPTVWTWASYRLRFPVAFRCLPKTVAAGSSHLALAPRQASQGSLTLTFRYLLTPQDEDDP